MTDTLARPSARPRAAVQDRLPDRRLLRDAGLAAAGAAVRGLLVVGLLSWLVWAAEDRSGSDPLDVARAVGQLWLLAHGAWLDLPVGRLGLTPLGLTLLPLLLCRRAGRRVAAAHPASRANAVGAAVALPYAVLAGVVAGVVAAVSAGDALRPVPLVAAAAAFLLAAAAATLGARSAHPGGPDRRHLARLRRAVLGGTTAVAVLCAAGALLVALALLMDAGTATELAASAEPGAVGGLGLLAVGAALMPNAVVWAVSWLAGPGFAVGVGTSASPFGTDLGPVPSLPLLAALPGGPPPSAAVLALAVPVVAGVVAGRLVARGRPALSWRDVAVDAVAAGVVAGVLLGALAALSGGPLGADRLSAVGPSAWQVAGAGALEVALGAASALAVLRRRSGAG